jgi:putative endonuclease
MWEYKTKAMPGFTSRYNIDRLMYYEVFCDVSDGMAQEKQIKGCGRAKKIALIARENSGWNDLSTDWTSRRRFVVGL